MVDPKDLEANHPMLTVLSVYEAHNTVAQLTQFYGSLLREQERLLRLERAKVLGLEAALKIANGTDQTGGSP